jgi:hypothetical protein
MFISYFTKFHNISVMMVYIRRDEVVDWILSFSSDDGLDEPSISVVRINTYIFNL